MKFSILNFQFSINFQCFKKHSFFLIGILLIGISLVIGNWKLEIGVANAQIPPHNPTPIPCTSTGNPEFHSLRPYQASPCVVTVENYAKFCRNTLTLENTVPGTYPGDGNCTTTNGTVTCNYTKNVNLPITIDLSGANLPIMGNTEDVPNSQPPGSPTPLTDTQKVNDYVSWYLNGVENRAENGSSENSDANAVNFSGPINKLLPSAILDDQRIKTVENVASNQNHNQIAVCADHKYWLFGPVTPKECYQGNGAPASGEVRLSEWNKNDLGVGRDLTKVLGRFLKMIPGISQTEIANAINSAWDKRTPPLPWADENGKPFVSDLLYQKAYNEWKGKSCVIFLNHLFCIDWDPTDILVNSEWSELYSYIPLSSTEDVKGNIKVDQVSSATNPATSGVNVTNVSFSGQTPADLFFSHMTEANEEAALLQSTFVAGGEAQVGSPTEVESEASCDTVEVRSNKGDNLFAQSISGNLSYTANFSCDFTSSSCTTPATGGGDVCRNRLQGSCVPASWSCEKKYGQVDCLDGYVCGEGCICQNPSQTCTKNVYIALSTLSKTPKIDDVWSRLVAGPTAIVKRLFPKLGTQIGTLKDMPGSTSITYTGASADSAQLNLPHVGGISEYFLKGIQTLLRPKGYGASITFGETTNTGGGVCDGSLFKKLSPPSQTTSKASDYFNSTVKPKLTPFLISVYAEAEKQTGIPCEVFAGIHYIEGGNDPNRSLISGTPLGTPEPNEGGRVFTSLLDTATYVAGRIKDKVGGDVSTWQKLVTALSRYNGGGNRNCQQNFEGGNIPYASVPGNCPPLYEGEDDIYTLSWIDTKHLVMYLLYCSENTPCPPQVFERPGIMTVATDLYVSEKK